MKTRKKNTAALLVKLEHIKDIRFRSPTISGNIAEEYSMKLNRYGLLLTDGALVYRLRNKVQITISDRQGNPSQGIFRVCGIYKTSNTGFDQVSVFVNAGELADLYGGNEILTHEIAILLNNIDDADIIKEKLKKVPGDNSVRTWKELAPDAAMMNDFMLFYYFIFIGIIMLALAFGIINTMLMAILERTKELGMLMAIGMNRRKVFSMIMLETVFLTVVGALSGIFSGLAITAALGKTGIHFSSWGEGFEAIDLLQGYILCYPEFFVLTR